MINSLIVVGGGTSGLISSLMLKTSYPSLKVTVIESSHIGIIGVGEGSTEHWAKFMHHVGISIPDLVRETGATYKIGIKFNNWHGDGTTYWHSLSDSFTPASNAHGLHYMFLKLVSENCDPEDGVWCVSKAGRHTEPLHTSTSQYHFDTNKLNAFLHKFAKQKGIEFIDCDIKDVELDEEGYVSSLIDQNNQRYSSDFYVDCSGFKRVVGSKLGMKWVSCQEQLPMNSAIAFPTSGTHDIPNYTEATALTSGWSWRIPTQERYGNGYVFCDSFITEDQAQQELESIHGSITIGKKIKFDPGYVDRFFVKNCVVSGLSSLFVEPLEASSIGTTIQQMFLLIPNIFTYTRGENKTANIYNSFMEQISQNVIDFIQLHYFTQRNDSEFWRWCKSNMQVTHFNHDTLDYFRTNWVNSQYFPNPMQMFSALNWIQVMHGLRLFDTEKIRSKYLQFLPEYIEIANASFYSITNDLPESFTHREALELIKQRYNEVTYEF